MSLRSSSRMPATVPAENPIHPFEGLRARSFYRQAAIFRLYEIVRIPDGGPGAAIPAPYGGKVRVVNVAENHFGGLVPENDPRVFVGLNNSVARRLHNRTKTKLRHSNLVLLPTQFLKRSCLSDRVSDRPFQQRCRELVLNKKIRGAHFHGFHIQPVVSHSGKNDDRRFAFRLLGLSQKLKTVATVDFAVEQTNLVGRSVDGLESCAV